MAGAMDVTSPCADEASRGVTKCLAGCRSVERTTGASAFDSHSVPTSLAGALRHFVATTRR